MKRNVQFSFAPKAKVRMEVSGSGSGLAYVGQVEGFAVTPTSDDDVVMDFTSLAGGEAEVRPNITSVAGTMHTHSLSLDVMRAMLMSAPKDDASAVVTDQEKSVIPGTLVEFTGIAPTSVTVARRESDYAAWVAEATYALGAYVVPVAASGRFYKCTTAGDSGASEPTWPSNGTTVTDGTVVWSDVGTLALVAGTDYTVDPAGVDLAEVIEGVTAGSILTVSYTSTAATRMEGFTAPGTEFRIKVSGRDASQGGKALVVDLFRVVFQPGQFDAILAKHANPTLNFKLLADPRNSGDPSDPLSPFLAFQYEGSA